MKKFLNMKIRLLVFLALIFLVSCEEEMSSEEPVEPPIQNETPPAKAVGTLPVNGEPCSDYEEVSGDDSKVSVLFNWNSAQFADSYVLTVLEGNNQVFTGSFTTLNANVELDRGKTFSWSVTSVNEDGQTNGDTNSFTTPGTPIGNFAPYTAEISISFDEGTSEMTVTWVGSDEDGNELTFDVEVFEEGQSVFDSVNLTSTSIGPIGYMLDTDYTVEVISRDGFGNFSVARLEVTSPD